MRDFIDRPRRVIGLVFLAIALFMAFLGQTTFHGRFSPLGYIFYWLLCSAFTVLAACVALVDLMKVKAESRKAHGELIDDIMAHTDQQKNFEKTKDNDQDKSG